MVKKADPLSRKERFEQLRRKLNERYNHEVITRASEIPHVFGLRRPTGIPMLDFILRGGWPAGGPSHLIGEEGAGKTDLAWRTLAQCQKNYGEDYLSAMACVEHWPDLSQARFAGLQVPMTPEELDLLEQSEGKKLSKKERAGLQREVGQTNFITSDTTEGLLDQVIDLYASGLYQVIVIDSIGAMQPSMDIQRDLDDANRVAGLSIILTSFMKKIWSVSMSRLPDGSCNETTLLILNQYREEVNLRNARMNNLRIGGGRALKHGKLVDVLLRRSAWIVDEQKSRIGKRVIAQVLKGKAGMHEGDSCEWEFLFKLGVDVADSYLTAALEGGSAVMAGSWCSVLGRKVQGRAKAKIRALENSQQIMDALYERHNVPPFKVRS